MLSKLDQNHPLASWLSAQQMGLSEASAAIGRSQACVGRWIRGDREPGVLDQEKIAALTEGEVPETYWREQAVDRALRGVA